MNFVYRATRGPSAIVALVLLAATVAGCPPGRNGSCTDPAGCMPQPTCGDGAIDPGEACDGTEFGAMTCESFNLTSGSLTCTDCQIQRTTCRGPDLIVYQAALLRNSSIQNNATVSACSVTSGCAGGTTGRRLFHFTLVSENIGNETLYFGGPRAIAAPYTGLWVPTCFGGRYEFPDYADFWVCPESETDCSATGSNRVATGHKGSFCFIENFGRAPDWTGAPATCGMYTCGNMGQQPGCADDYYVGLDCQYVDVTDLAAGNYTLCAHLDPRNFIHELRDDNNIGCTSIVIP